MKKIYYTWNKIYRVSFSIKVSKMANANVIHFTTGLDQSIYSLFFIGSQIPAVWLNKSGFFHICSTVSGNRNYCKNINYSLGKQYDITIQQYNHNGKYMYEIIINGLTKVCVENTQPRIFSHVKEYTSNPWYSSFTSDFGNIFNLEIEQ